MMTVVVQSVIALAAATAIAVVLVVALFSHRYLRLRAARRRAREVEMASYRRRTEFRERTGMPGTLYPHRPSPATEAINRVTASMKNLARALGGEAT